MSADQAIRNGTDVMLVNYPAQTNDVQFRDTNGAKEAMRTSAKNVLYVVVNSRAYDPANLNTGMPVWMYIMIGADVVIGALLILWFVMNRSLLIKSQVLSRRIYRGRNGGTTKRPS